MPLGEPFVTGQRGVGVINSLGPILFLAVATPIPGSDGPGAINQAPPPAQARRVPTVDLPSTSTSSVAEAAEPLTLNALITEALANNLQVKVTESQIGEAQALLQFAEAQAYPQASLRVLFGAPTPEAQTRVLNDIDTVTDASLGGDFNFGSLGVSLRINGQVVQPVYTFGKIDKGKEAAGHLVRASKHQKTIAQAELVVNVNRAFWAFQLTQAFLDSLGEGKNTLAKVLDRIEELLEADSGQVTENDRLRLKYALSTLNVREAEAHQAAQTALRAMRLLLGWPQTRDLVVERRDLDELP
ncbi:MAG: TolC family protein [Myxococcota bacterium]